MTMKELQQLWKNYQDAWADIPVTDRERLLQQSVADDVVFTSPPNEGKGIGELVRHIGDFQTQFPGAYFKSNKLFTQHGQLLAEWTMFNKDGSEFLTAHSYAQLNEQGLLTHLAGFWQV
jgi:hypothetical protein